jgi:hypothetical protein
MVIQHIKQICVFINFILFDETSENFIYEIIKD